MMMEAEYERRARERLAGAGLRPTRQRLGLAALLFAGPCRHVTAEILHGEAEASGAGVSLATVYNTLRAFTEAGLVRQVSADGARIYFDTNVEPHHHFYDEDTGALTDIAAADVVVETLPDAPPGAEIASVDVVVRLRSKS